MKTVHLTEEGFAEISAALEEKGRGLAMLVDMFTAGRGPDSEAVKNELAKFRSLASAAHELHGVSTWRSNARGSTLPPDSIFEPHQP